MIKRKNQGVVLKNNDYKENGSIVTFLTEEGLVNLIVRGTRNPNSKTRKFTNAFSYIEFVQTDNRQLNTFTEGVVINSFSYLYDDYEKLNSATIITEKILTLINSVTEMAVLYNFYLDILKCLEKTTHPKILTLLFEAKLWYLLGIAPNFKKCSICHQPYYQASFIIQIGGVVCSSCLVKQEYKYNLLDNDSTEALKCLYLIKLSEVSDEFLKIIEPYSEILEIIIDEYYSEYLGFSSKSKKIFKKIKQ